MGQKSSSESFKFAHTSFMLSNPKTWRRITIGVVVALVLVLILLVLLVVVFVVLRPQDLQVQRDTGSPSNPNGNPNGQNAGQPVPNGCFPPESIVLTVNGKKRMDELIIGDMVSDVDENGHLRFSRIYAWFRKSSQTGLFLELSTDNGATLLLSKNHLIFRYSPVNGTHTVLASEIQIGDLLFTSNSFNYSKVVLIKTTVRRGLYAPVTLSGTFFVDDVLVSCYTDYWINGLVGHKFIHQIALLPLRLLSTFSDDKSGWIFQPTRNENLWFVEMWKFINVILTSFVI